ncbi:MAG: DOPA 4,5-dioxygenase family protein [Gammaproteobacteria bacterium]
MDPSAAAPRPVNRYAHYHAHVYFDADTVERARRLCELAGERFEVTVGRVHERCVGPHPHWSCQLAFDAAVFDSLVPWLEQHRDGLTVLVHGLTGDALADHTRHASWLGTAATLDLSVFDDA